MTTIDCPWCTGACTLDDDANVVECDACGIRADLAADPPRAAELESAA